MLRVSQGRLWGSFYYHRAKSHEAASPAARRVIPRSLLDAGKSYLKCCLERGNLCAKYVRCRPCGIMPCIKISDFIPQGRVPRADAGGVVVLCPGFPTCVVFRMPGVLYMQCAKSPVWFFAQQCGLRKVRVPSPGDFGSPGEALNTAVKKSGMILKFIPLSLDI